ncbi:pngase family [Apiospora hydei]|uniref:Pngase family n=1 Tax=Apiospora hydei TaxID=1337664 RepID=A0ABR1XA31_9PEZI
MPFPRVPTFGKKWASPELSCGTQIMTTRLGCAKRAWWAHGAALEKFEKDIEPLIGATLRNIELRYTEIYYRLYMIGKRAETSRPIIMICCTEPRVKNDVESIIRQSGVLNEYPEFGLGACALPLEQPTPARPLAEPEDVAMTDGDDSDLLNGLPPRDTSACLAEAPLGSKIAILDEEGQHQITTGGIVVQAGRRFYQMTAKHTPERINSRMEPAKDLDECHFDGQSDNEEEDEEADWDATTHGSRTPTNSPPLPWAEDHHSESSNSQGSSQSSHPVDLRPTEGQLGKLEEPSDHGHMQVVSSGLESILRGDGLDSGLDYVLLPLDGGDPKAVNEVKLRDPARSPILRVPYAVEIPSRQCRVVAVTGSSGVLHGALLPGATYLRLANSAAVQKLHVIQLQGAVVEGDCGSAVLDERSGGFYGHISADSTEDTESTELTENTQSVRSEISPGTKATLFTIRLSKTTRMFLEQGKAWDLIYEIIPPDAMGVHPKYRQELHYLFEDLMNRLVSHVEQEEKSGSSNQSAPWQSSSVSTKPSHSPEI